MPIYEFYCESCHCIYQFFSHSVNTRKRPKCPTCGRPKLERQVSSFAIGGRHKEGEEELDNLPINEAAMEKAMMQLAAEAEGMNEDDPKQAAALMRKFSDATGLELGDSMQEAMARLEAGEDPDTVEAEMGDLLDSDDPLSMLKKVKQHAAAGQTRGAVRRDETLYDL
ncbi:MAG: FmdB family zinc ribbon protein [Planctomycetota bacterium]|jgi:putative FmdB family regulatory protein